MDEPQIAVMQYCERIGAGSRAEPVNALTNLAFLVAALAIAYGLHHASRPLRKTWDLWLLASLVAAVGVGSFLWQTLATAWSQLAGGFSAGRPERFSVLPAHMGQPCG